jgi:hypothetical protein
MKVFNTDQQVTTNSIHLLLFFLAVSSFLAVLIIDMAVLGIGPLAEGPPLFGTGHLLRTVLIMMGSFFLVSGAVQRGKKGRQNEDLWSRGIVPRSWTKNRWAMAMFFYLLVLVSLLFLLLFLFHPHFFSQMSREGKPVEVLSAALCFTSSAIFLLLLRNLRRYPSQFSCQYLVTALAFAGVFFLIGMEEVSWFQRVLAVETPEAFQGNVQREMNLHNFFTDETENLYYMGAFLFLILIPFLNYSYPSRNRFLTFFIPGEHVMLASAVFTAYNYDMWNIMLTQLAFFCTLFILGYYAWQAKPERHAREALCLLLVVAATQLLFLLYGRNFERLWDVTEYKEFFIPVAFLLYSVQMLRRMKDAAWMEPTALGP